MSQINRVPKGLQALLASKNFGINPANLLQDVRPAIDVDKFFGVESLKFNRDDFTGAPTTNSVLVTTTIPVGELWEIINVSGTAIVSGALNDDMSLFIRLNNINNDLPAGNAHFLSSARWTNFGTNTATGAVHYNPTQPLLLEGGTLIELWVGAYNLAGNQSFTLETCYRRYTV